MAGRHDGRRVGYQDVKVDQSSESGFIMGLWKEQGWGKSNMCSFTFFKILLWLSQGKK